MLEIVAVNITGLDHYGRGIGRVNDKIIFIPNSLIGEIVNVKITNTKRNYLEGEVINFVKSSPNRVIPQCPYYFECGGCDLMHTSYENQVEYKENKVKEIMKKFANIEDNFIKPIIKSDDIYNYRNKVTFQVKKGIGFYKKKSYDIVNIDVCLISDNRINDLITLIKDNIKLDNIDQIIVRSSRHTNDLMVIFSAKGPINEAKIIRLIGSEVTSIVKKINGKYVLMAGNDHIIDQIGDLKFIISPDSFFQINTNQATRLYNKVLEYAKLKGSEKVLDLYCGTGTIGLYLGRYCGEVLGVEVNKYAVDDALKNKELNNIKNINFKCSDVSRIVNEIKFKPEVVIIDPPRSGLDSNTIYQLMKFNSEKIVYVSCDPVTLARDLKILKEKYSIVEITPVDMFVNTYHVETVTLLNKMN